MGLSAGTGRSPAPLAVSLMAFLCTFVAAASAEAPAGFCPAPGLHVSSVCGRSQICLQAPRLRLLSARRAANRARLSEMCSRDDDTHDHGESKGTDVEAPKRVESASDPESIREEALREKLERWKSKAEAARLADPDSATARALSIDPATNKIDISGSRGAVVNRMRNLKLEERRAELSQDVRLIREQEEGPRRRARDTGETGVFSDTPEARREVVKAGMAELNGKKPLPSLEYLEKAGIENRPNERITAKLEEWRKTSAEQRSQDPARITFNVIATVLNAVAFLIGLPLGLLTGKWVDLPEVWEDVTNEADMAAAAKRQESLRAFYREMDGLRESMRGKWRDSAMLSGGLPGIAKDAQRAEVPDAASEMRRMAARRERRAAVAEELQGLVESDDGEGVTLLFRRLYDDADVAGWLIIGGGKALLAAAELGHARAAESLLQEGCDVTLRDGEGRTALEIARGAGHVRLAEMIAAAASD